MSVLRVSFFLFVFLSHSSVFSEPIAEISEKAETVFTNFVIDLLSEVDTSEEALNKFTESIWLEDITEDTENWTADEAREFLSVLQSSGIEPNSLLNILLSTNYLKALKEKPAFRFSTEPASSGRLTAGEVFFNYVDNHLGTSEIEDRMGSKWLTLILTHTQNWTDRNAIDFLNFLEASEVQLESILNLLQATDYLQKLKSGQIDLDFLKRSNIVVVESTSPSISPQPLSASQNTVSDQSAGDIFIERAKEYFRTEFEQQREKKYKNMTYEEAFKKKMGSTWEDKLRRSTKNWTPEDARAFLSYLSNRIGEEAALNRIKYPSYFKEMKTYNRFLEYIVFYEKYIGEAGVTHRLNRSLKGFERADFVEIEKVIEFLEEYLGNREFVEGIMMENLNGFSRLNSKPTAQTNLANLKDVIAYLEDIGITEATIKSKLVDNFTGFVQATRKKLETRRQSLTKPETVGIAFTHAEINKMIIENMQGFINADLEKVKMMITTLKRLGFEHEQIKKMAIGNLKGLAAGDPETLENKKQSLTKPETVGLAFTLDEVNQMIAKNIEGFLQADLKKVKKMVTYLKDKNTGLGLEEQQLKEMAIRNLKGLDLSDPETLEYKRQSLTKLETIGIAFTLDEVNQMIAESIQGFLQADLKKVKKMVTYLKDKNTGLGLEEQQLKKMAIRNLKGLALSDPETLEYKRQSLTKLETIGIAFTLDEVNQMIAESIQSFLQADLKKVKKMVTYLKDKNTGLGLEDKQVKEMAIGNLKGLALSDPETLEYKRQSLTKPETIGIAFTLDEVNQMIAESIQGFLQADLKKVKKMVTYLKDKNTGLGLEDTQVKKMAIRNLKGLALGDPQTLENKRQSLTKLETIGVAFALDEIDKMIVESIQGFMSADLEKVKKIVTYLKDKNTGLGLEDKQIKEMAIGNLKGLALSDPETLEDRRQSLTKPETIGIAFTLDEINQMIVDNIEGFLQSDLKKVVKMITYLKDKNTGLGLEDKQIKEMAIRNLQGLALGDPKTLEKKRQSLTKPETIGIAFTLDEINQMIVENIQDFLRVDLKKVEKMVTYLKDKNTGLGLEDKQVKEMAIGNLQGLALSDPETLESKRQSLTKPETIGIAFTLDEVNQMIAESIQGFLQAGLKKVKKMVTYLKDKNTGLGLEDKQIKDMLIRNLIGFSTIKSYALENMIEALKQQLQLSKTKEKTLITEIREMIVTQNLIDFYYNFDANLKTLICTQSLSN